MSLSIDENILYYWLGIFHFLKGIRKHKYNEISFDWYNHLVFKKTGCRMKMIETKMDVIQENKLDWKT